MAERRWARHDSSDTRTRGICGPCVTPGAPWTRLESRNPPVRIRFGTHHSPRKVNREQYGIQTSLSTLSRRYLGQTRFVLHLPAAAWDANRRRILLAEGFTLCRLRLDKFGTGWWREKEWKQNQFYFQRAVAVRIVHTSARRHDETHVWSDQTFLMMH